MLVEFEACEHLDYEPHYGNCKRQLISCGGTKLCWMRAINKDLVQFCKLRGRINSPTGCLDEKKAGCSEFANDVRLIEVPQEETE